MGTDRYLSSRLHRDALPDREKDDRGPYRTRSEDEDRSPCGHGKGDSAHDMPQLPMYKDKSNKTPFVCWFMTTFQYVFLQVLAGEDLHPTIISRH